MVSQVFPAGGFREGADAGVRRSYGRPLGGKQLYAGAEAGRHAGSGHGTPDKVHLHG